MTLSSCSFIGVNLIISKNEQDLDLAWQCHAFRPRFCAVIIESEGEVSPLKPDLYIAFIIGSIPTLVLNIKLLSKSDVEMSGAVSLFEITHFKRMETRGT